MSLPTVMRQTGQSPHPFLITGHLRLKTHLTPSLCLSHMAGACPAPISKEPCAPIRSKPPSGPVSPSSFLTSALGPFVSRQAPYRSPPPTPETSCAQAPPGTMSFSSVPAQHPLPYRALCNGSFSGHKGGITQQSALSQLLLVPTPLLGTFPSPHSGSIHRAEQSGDTGREQVPMALGRCSVTGSHSSRAVPSPQSLPPTFQCQQDAVTPPLPAPPPGPSAISMANGRPSNELKESQCAEG